MEQIVDFNICVAPKAILFLKTKDKSVFIKAFLTFATDGVKKKKGTGTSLVAQWLGLRTPNARGPGFDPWSGN